MTEPDGPAPAVRRRLLLRDIESPRDVLLNLTPTWYASVMGAGIVAIAAAVVPGLADPLRPVAVTMWALSAVLLVGLIVLSVAQAIVHPQVWRRHLRSPVTAHFLGTIPMAILVVGAGADLVGRDLVGLEVAFPVHLVVWCIGTALGVAVAVGVPVATVLRSDVAPDQANGSWLLSVVPPFVSASSAYLLIPQLPAGQAQATMLFGSYALLGMSLIAAALTTMLIWFRLVHHDAGPVGLAPTLWIVLGPLGQSATAVGTLGLVAPGVVAGLDVDPLLGSVLWGVGAALGLPLLGAAALWTLLATVMTVRALRAGMPFGLGWWSFTFPIGVTCTGAAAVGEVTGSVLIDGMAVAYFGALALAWAVVAVRTAWGSVVRGTLFMPS